MINANLYLYPKSISINSFAAPVFPGRVHGRLQLGPERLGPRRAAPNLQLALLSTG